jgi:hypothetical protein
MADFTKRYQVARARQRYMREPSTGRPGLIGILVLIAVIAIVVWVAGLDRQSRESEARRLELVRATATDPIELLTAAARTHRVLLLGDVIGADAPKRFAADLIEALARGPGLDVVALEIDRRMQPRIDAYLNARDDDAALLLAQPRAVREWEGTGRSYLEIYRRIRSLNEAMGAARRIRVVAMDAPGWPPSPPPSPARLTQAFGERTDSMAATLEPFVLGRNDRARVLIFADGLLTLRALARIETGGEVLDSLPMLAARFERDRPAGIYSALVAAPGPPSPALGLAGYRPGRMFDELGAAAPAGTAFGFATTPGLPVGADDVEYWRTPGVRLRFFPTGNGSSLVDAWVRLPG